MKLPIFDPPLSARWANLSMGQKCVFPIAAIVVGAVFIVVSPLLLCGYIFMSWLDFWDPECNKDWT